MSLNKVLVVAGSHTATLAAALEHAAGRCRFADDVQVRPRNYDIEGPVPKAGPPTAYESNMPSRQQRRWQERQARKGAQQ